MCVWLSVWPVSLLVCLSIVTFSICITSYLPDGQSTGEFFFFPIQPVVSRLVYLSDGLAHLRKSLEFRGIFCLSHVRKKIYCWSVGQSDNQSFTPSSSALKYIHMDQPQPARGWHADYQPIGKSVNRFLTGGERSTQNFSSFHVLDRCLGYFANINALEQLCVNI